VLGTGDPERSAGFYRDLFGWQTRLTGPGLTEFTLRDLVVAGMAPADTDPLAWLVHISTEDMASTVAAVVAAGGSVRSGPADVGSRGRVAVFTDPEGAAFAAWQRGTFAGAQITSEPDTISWSEVAMRDPAGAAEFYGKVFGWAERRGGLITRFDYRDWETAGRVVAGMIPMTDDLYPAHVPGHWRISIEVIDCAAAASRCADLGGRVIAGPMAVGIGDYAYLRDPSGAGFGVIELLPHLRAT
jgi:hypothetical protein